MAYVDRNLIEWGMFPDEFWNEDFAEDMLKELMAAGTPMNIDEQTNPQSSATRSMLPVEVSRWGETEKQTVKRRKRHRNVHAQPAEATPEPGIILQFNGHKERSL